MAEHSTYETKERGRSVFEKHFNEFLEIWHVMTLGLARNERFVLKVKGRFCLKRSQLSFGVFTPPVYASKQTRPGDRQDYVISCVTTEVLAGSDVARARLVITPVTRVASWINKLIS